MNLHPGTAVLLVDDKPANLLALEAVLAELGATLVRADSGQEALKRVFNTDFAAILLDVRMPGMGGFEAARLIRAKNRSKDTPIIFVTASDRGDLAIEEAYALGAVDFLTKPIIPAVLKAKVSFFIELYRSKEELRAAERRAVNERAFLAAVLESVEDSIVACDPEGVLTLFNRATRELHGLSEQPLAAEQWADHYDIYRPDGKTPMTSAEIPLFRALAGEQVRNAEMIVAPKGSKPRTLLASGQSLYDEAGRKLGAVVSMHDVTAQREAGMAREAAVREQARRQEAEAAAELIQASEERARLATDAAELGLWLWDPATDIVTWENDRTYDLFGLPRSAEPVNAARFFREYVHPDDSKAFKRAIALTVQTGARFHFDGRFFRRPSGEMRWIEFTGLLQPAADGAPRRVLGTAADITERKLAEEVIRASEDRYRTLFESMDEGFCVIEMIFDAQGRPVDYMFLEANPAFTNHSGLVDVVGKTRRQLVPDDDSHWFETYGRVAVTGTPVRLVEEVKATGRWFDVYANRVGGPDSRKVAVLGNDISVRKQTEQDLRKLAAELSESDRRKTEFLATLAHELRNPLAPLRNGLHVMGRAGGNLESLEKTRAMMDRQVSHMVRLIDDLLDIARVSSGKVELRKERVSLQAVVESAVETSLPLVEAGRHELAVRIPDEPLLLDADPTRLAQVLSNLLNNAAKYTPDGGRIELTAACEGSQVIVSVTDTGVGIPKESLLKVFQMFSQVGRNLDRSQGGLGIGLSLVRRLVELHGGTVSADSGGAGRGSTFSIRLPLVSADAAEAVSALPLAGTKAVLSQIFRVLVVDDNVDAADSLALILEMGGHSARVANDGGQAIRVAQEFSPEVVFLDIGMPGKNGYEVARDLRKMVVAQQPVLVALTGWGAEDDRARSKDAGFDHHLTKPAEIADVEQLLAGLAPRQP